MRLSCGLFCAARLRASAERLSALPFVHITRRRIAATWQVIQTKSSWSHQAAGVNRYLHAGCCHQLYFIHHTHGHATRAALHTWDQPLKHLEVRHTALGRHVRWHDRHRHQWRGVSLCSFASFLCSLKSCPSANSTCFRPPSLLPVPVEDWAPTCLKSISADVIIISQSNKQFLRAVLRTLNCCQDVGKCSTTCRFLGYHCLWADERLV